MNDYLRYALICTGAAALGVVIYRRVAKPQRPILYSAATGTAGAGVGVLAGTLLSLAFMTERTFVADWILPGMLSIIFSVAFQRMIENWESDGIPPGDLFL